MIINDIIEKQFAFLKGDATFAIMRAQYDGWDLKVIFRFRDIWFTIESYKRELSLYISSAYYSEEKVNLVNLIEFLSERGVQKIKSHFYHDVPSIEESYRKQIEWLAHTVESFLPQIITFCSKGDYWKIANACLHIWLRLIHSFFAD